MSEYERPHREVHAGVFSSIREFFAWLAKYDVADDETPVSFEEIASGKNSKPGGDY